jgi:hypothetical protein
LLGPADIVYAVLDLANPAGALEQKILEELLSAGRKLAQDELREKKVVLTHWDES